MPLQEKVYIVSWKCVVCHRLTVLTTSHAGIVTCIYTDFKQLTVRQNQRNHSHRRTSKVNAKQPGASLAVKLEFVKTHTIMFHQCLLAKIADKLDTMKPILTTK